MVQWLGLHTLTARAGIQFLVREPKTLADTSPKKKYWWQISTWKDAEHMSSGKGKLKQQWDIVTHLLEWPNPEHWQHQMPVRMWSYRNSHLLLVRMKNGAAGASLVAQWLRLRAPIAGGRGLIPSWGTRSHMTQLRVCMPQLKILHAARKIPHTATKSPHATTRTDAAK